MRAVVTMSGVLLGFAVLACNDANFKGSTPQKPAVLSLEHTQDAYPVSSVRYEQGHRGAPGSESFAQINASALDILVVVDNSQSMEAEQKNLATKLQPLLSKVQDADWQIKVVTTDQRDGCNGALIKKTDADAATLFEQAVTKAGIQGDGVERGIAQAVTGLQCPAQPWLRASSTVAVLVLTDEDNCHAGIGDDAIYACLGQAGRYAEYLTNYLASIRTLGETARVYALMWHPNQTQDQCPTALNRGHEYAKAIAASNGKFGSICDADYTNTLQAISADVAQTLRYSFELKETPDAGTLVVRIDGQNWDKFELDGKTLKFSEPPAMGAKVEVSYRYGAQGELLGSFKLPKAAAAGSIQVKVNANLVAPQDLSYDAATSTVTLKQTPDERAVVEIEYREVIPLKEQFQIGTGYEPSSVKIWVDGNPAAGQYDAATGVVVISPAPPAEAKIKISYRRA